MLWLSIFLCVFTGAFSQNYTNQFDYMCQGKGGEVQWWFMYILPSRYVKANGTETFTYLYFDSSMSTDFVNTTNTSSNFISVKLRKDLTYLDNWLDSKFSSIFYITSDKTRRGMGIHSLF